MAALRDVLGAWRAGWQRGSQRVTVDGPPVIERVGEDVHRPIRRPDRWKVVQLLGGAVWVDRKRAGNGLLECPECAALVVDEWAKARHQPVCPGRRVVAAADPRATELEESRAAAGGFAEEEGEWVG